MRRQCELLAVNRSMLYYEPATESELNLRLMREIDEIHLDYPFMGIGMMTDTLNRNPSRSEAINHKRVRRLMKKMGITAVYPKPKTSTPATGHRIYPYLLRDREIKAVNEVWCADITYLPMARGYLYLVAIMDWYSRFVLSWKLSNTMETDFCLEALGEATSNWGKAEIFNTDQGAQFTANVFTTAVENAGMKMSMDGRGRWIDNRFIERLWRSLKSMRKSISTLTRAVLNWSRELTDGLTSIVTGGHTRRWRKQRPTRHSAKVKNKSAATKPWKGSAVCFASGEYVSNFNFFFLLFGSAPLIK